MSRSLILVEWPLECKRLGMHFQGNRSDELSSDFIVSDQRFKASDEVWGYTQSQSKCELANSINWKRCVGQCLFVGTVTLGGVGNLSVERRRKGTLEMLWSHIDLSTVGEMHLISQVAVG